MAWLTEQCHKLLQEYNISFKENNSSFILDCPTCLKQNRLYIRKRDGATICFACAALNNQIGVPEIVLEKLLPLSSQVIRNRLRNINIDDLTIEEILEKPKEERYLTKTTFPITFIDNKSPLFVKAQRYLDKRGLSYGSICFYSIKYDTVSMRIILPVYFNGDLVGWQARYIGDHEKDRVPKVLNSPGFNKALCLYNYDNIKFGKDYLVLTEGPIDCIKADYIDNNVASLGKIVSDEQINLILKTGIKRLYLGLDRDAYIETMDLINRISLLDDTIKFYLLEPPSNRHDLGDCTYEEVVEQFKIAPPITRSDFLAYF